MRLALKEGIALKDSELEVLDSAIKSIASEHKQYEYVLSVLLLRKQSADFAIKKGGEDGTD